MCEKLARSLESGESPPTPFLYGGVDQGKADTSHRVQNGGGKGTGLEKPVSLVWRKEVVGGEKTSRNVQRFGKLEISEKALASQFVFI